MDDLISRAAAIDAHKRAAYWQDGERKIAELPAVDAMPVVHGRWEEVDDVWVDVHYRCSACDYEWFLEDGTPAENWMNYCPHCGAKMDGERREYGENSDTKRE